MRQRLIVNAMSVPDGEWMPIAFYENLPGAPMPLDAVRA